ncbi:Leucine-rich repeat-containing protein 40 [Hondaea fermentalgiana]|uniref:Leucine-rich repeat-containing protein 40 n=1 Tax=Hondaea fermentalgiana TaxID=2315210 RepID=A0A2R5GS54_9STRA|nr:Leucine-rich repeat-containing protein 40 [Hondaea fermentalgiana]|eukprot:GBG33680.1 Leucine-rich repeat-containing protein 40 [Hondaea fermentalgiana]
MRVRKRFDRRSGSVYLEDLQTGTKLRYVERLIAHDLDMDEREELEFEDFRKHQHEEMRLKLAFAERETKRNIERDASQAAKEQAAIDELAGRWAGPLKAADITGELIANWLRFTEISPLVWEMGPQLTLIRLIGNPLVRVPGSLFLSLSQLEIISFSNCGLVELPEEITTLSQLRDLNLMRNELESLPSRIGDLTKLEGLHVSCNKLKALPESIGALQAMPRLGIEKNQISDLPATIVDMNCKIMSWTQAGLVRLPENLAAFGSKLVSLTADHNRIRRIPKGIGKLSQLKHLSLCNNLIKFIPDEICKCQNLERLWLDWNQISELPSEFPNLEKLQSIHLEGNPMRVPQMDVVVQGVPALRTWFESNINLYRDKERKLIVEHLQSILAILAEEGLHDPSLFIAGMKTDDIGDPAHDLYFAFVPGYLREVAIPRFNAFIQELFKNQAEVERRRKLYTRRQELAERQEQLEIELSESLEFESLQSTALPGNNTQADQDHENEPESTGGRNEAHGEDHDSMFGSPVDRTDILSPFDGKVDGEAEHEVVKQVSSTVRQKDVILKELAATQAALHGQFGAVQTERTPEEERVRLTKIALGKVRHILEPFDFTDTDIEEALQTFEDRFGKVFVRDQTANFRRCSCMRNGEPRLCVPPNLHFNCERRASMLKIGLVTYFTRAQRDSINEETRVLDERLIEVDQEAKTYATSEKGKAFFRLLAHAEAGNLLEQERRERFVLRKQVRLERRRRRKHASINKKKEALLKARDERTERLNKVRFKYTAQLERLRGWEAQECSDRIREIDDDLANHPQDMALEILQIEEDTVDERFKVRSDAEVIMARYRPRGRLRAYLHERLTMMHARRAQDLRKKLEEAYALAERRRVSLETRREYRVMRRIMFNWMHLGVRMTFESWREHTRRTVYWRKYLAMERDNQRQLDEAAKDAEKIFQAAEYAKWTERIDPFSDLPYWEHCETFEVRHDPPVLEECDYVPRVPMRRGSLSMA